jgi:hypothetical protein
MKDEADKLVDKAVALIEAYPEVAKL